MGKRRFGWKHYLLEFITVFVGVTLAFALSTWNEARRDSIAEEDILLELVEGLNRDSEDLQTNILGHEAGIRAATAFLGWVNGDSIPDDSLNLHYHCLLRDFVSVQNKTSYEVLKSKGLELVKDDSLRYQIVSLYDFDYEVIEKLEEDYAAMQFFQLYSGDVDRITLPYISMEGNRGMRKISEAKDISSLDRKKFLVILNHLRGNRFMLLHFYKETLTKIEEIQAQLKALTSQ